MSIVLVTIPGQEEQVCELLSGPTRLGECLVRLPNNAERWVPASWTGEMA